MADVDEDALTRVMVDVAYAGIAVCVGRTDKADAVGAIADAVGAVADRLCAEA